MKKNGIDISQQHKCYMREPFTGQNNSGCIHSYLSKHPTTGHEHTHKRQFLLQGTW